MPTGGLIPGHPFGSAPCSTRAESPAAWPAKLCLGAQQTSALRHHGRYLGRESVIVVRNYFFPSFFTWPTRIHDAQPELDTSRRNRITPISKQYACWIVSSKSDILSCMILYHISKQHACWIVSSKSDILNCVILYHILPFWCNGNISPSCCLSRGPARRAIRF